MSVNHCDGVRLGRPCTTLFAVGLTRCPHCRSTDFHEFGSWPSDEEHPMAKISALTGPTNATVAADEPAPPVEPAVDASGDDSTDEPVTDTDEASDELGAEEGDGGDGLDEATEPPAPEKDVPASDAEVRQWALDNDVEVSASGRVSKAVREAYDAAHAPAG